MGQRIDLDPVGAVFDFKELERRAIAAGEIGKQLVLDVADAAESKPDMPLEAFLTLRGR